MAEDPHRRLRRGRGGTLGGGRDSRSRRWGGRAQRSLVVPAFAMDMSDTADIVATYADAGGRRRVQEWESRCRRRPHHPSPPRVPRSIGARSREECLMWREVRDARWMDSTDALGAFGSRSRTR
jgi:hypothetical protein